MRTNQTPPRASQETLDLLSEVLAVERDGSTLYRDFLDDAPESLRPKLVEYAEQSRRSVLLLEQAVVGVGGDPEYVSPGAKVVHGLTAAVLASTENAPVRRWMYRLLHLVAYELRDRLVWEALEALARREQEAAGAVLHTAAMAVRSEESWGAHMADRNHERIEWALGAMRQAVASEVGVEPASHHWWQRLLGGPGH